MARTHLFVDTNVLLDFYSYAKDDLGQLKRLIEHVHAEGICLHLPQHVMNELERNRETKLKTSAEQFKKESFPTAIPRHMQDYPQAKEYSAAVDTALKMRTALINQAAADAGSKTLAADKVIEALVEKAKVYPDDDATYARALQRMQKGNPPGKVGSVGDQYNWEFLLAGVPEEDLHIVSKDGDYSSLLNTGKPHPFLHKEWKDRKSSDLHVYGELRTFIDKYLAALAEAATSEQVAVEAQAATAIDAPAPVTGNLNVVLPPLEMAASGSVTSTNSEKEAAVKALAESATFAETHAAVAKLQPLRATLNKSDVERLLEAAIDNSQIRWIASDEDVYAFFTALLSEHADIDAGLFEAVEEVFGKSSDDSEL
ncbi:PIN domain-containing protein [Ralstonia chuxiongensis]|uniref:PIN domain-containing protein n=1 Tax=Ralstonia chuxiongensis TaxID=2957504 RepID=UPI00292EB8C7|nr:PIN domain-containing protein [Ralstonia chuxiongensis]